MVKHFALQPAARIKIDIPGYDPNQQAKRLKKKQQSLRARQPNPGLPVANPSHGQVPVSHLAPAKFSQNEHRPELTEAAPKLTEEDLDLIELNQAIQDSQAVATTLADLAKCFES